MSKFFIALSLLISATAFADLDCFDNHGNQLIIEKGKVTPLLLRLLPPEGVNPLDASVSVIGYFRPVYAMSDYYFDLGGYAKELSLNGDVGNNGQAFLGETNVLIYQVWRESKGAKVVVWGSGAADERNWFFNTCD